MNSPKIQKWRNSGLFLSQEGDIPIWGWWQWQHEGNESTESRELPLKSERITLERGEMGAELLHTQLQHCWQGLWLQSHAEFHSPKDLMMEGFLFLFMSGNIIYAISSCFTRLDVCWMEQEQQHKSPPQRSWRLAHHKTPQAEAAGFHWGGIHYFFPTLILFR